MDKKIITEMSFRISLDQVVSGFLYGYGTLDEAIKILKDTARAYELKLDEANNEDVCYCCGKKYSELSKIPGLCQECFAQKYDDTAEREYIHAQTGIYA